MEAISVFDMLKIGVGPSSSHTLGPWRAANRFLDTLNNKGVLAKVDKVRVDLYGSLSLTGKGHATDIACVLGLFGFDPTTYPAENIGTQISDVKEKKYIHLNETKQIEFIWESDLLFHREFLPYHPNGITFTAILSTGETKSETYYSIGGGQCPFEAKNRIIQSISLSDRNWS
jgi:L-serine dehydratase